MGISSKIKLIERKKLEDSRGWFLKVINGHEENLPNYTGEVYVTNATAGEAKGGHYHPLANEWFTLITGTCEVKLVNIAHIFINNSKGEFILLAYSDQLYLPEDTIMYTDF